MIYRAIAFALMAVFYTIYLGKMFLQRMRGISTDQMGKQQNKSGKNKKNDTTVTTKSKKVLLIEIIMKIATYSIVVVEAVSIIKGDAALGFTGRGILLKVFGTYIGLIADVIFFISVWTMRDSWRAGINTAGDTKLVTKGIYAFSRNPAFLAFDLLYISILLMYFNWLLLGFTVFAIVMLHIQILQEEKFLPQLFGEEYLKYKAHTGRYFGRGKWSFTSVKCLIYTITMIFSVLYYVTCIFYARITLSFVWIWLLLAAFCAVRIFMLHDVLIHQETGRPLMIKIPKFVKILYHLFFGMAAVAFLFIEINVVTYMNMKPKENLDYVIVLGAGLNGTQPTRPLQLRIQKAYNYMKNNPNTRLIASGGQGSDEIVSEASVIAGVLIEMGIEEDRIILEDQSRDTNENIRNSYELIYREFGTETKPEVGVVTNGFHIYRTRLIAAAQGHTGTEDGINGIPAQTLFPVGIHYVVREFFGVVQLVMGW